MNLIIDGNAFLNVCTSVVKTILFKNPRLGAQYWVEDLLNEDSYILKESSKKEFKEFSLRYLTSITSAFSNLESTYLVFDSKSWRKEFILNHFSTSADDGFSYKGHRKHDPHQMLFFEYFQTEILTSLAKAHILTLRIPGAEGDDIITRIIEKNPNSDFCIWSTDLDFFQLLENDIRSIILITPKMVKRSKCVYTIKNFKQDRPDFDIFDFSLASGGNTIAELQQKGFAHLEIDPNLEIIKKIVGGDGSDNIPRVIKQMTKKKVELFNLQILEKIPTPLKEIDDNTEAFLELLSAKVQEFCKITDSDQIALLKSNIKLNLSIIRLKSKFFPENVTRQIDSVLMSLGTSSFNRFELRKITF